MRNETELERWDRNFAELLQELRVAQTGVQILFAFMLTMPFTVRFAETTSDQKSIYIITLVSAATSMAFMIAPVSYHRMVFRQGRKPQLVRAASRMAKAGLVFMLAAVAGSVFLVLDVVAGIRWAAAVASGLAVLYILLWYVLPAIGAARSVVEANGDGPPNANGPSEEGGGDDSWRLPSD